MAITHNNTRIRWTLVLTWSLVALFLPVLNAQTPQASAGVSQAFTSGSNFNVESTAAVIPPGHPDCQNGKILIASGAGGSGQPYQPYVVARDLNEASGTVIHNLNGASLGTVIPREKFAGLSSADDINATADNVLTRLPESRIHPQGALLLVWGGTTTDPFPSAAVAQGSKQSQNNSPVRGVLYTWTSTNCGKTWQALARVDSGDTKLFGGACSQTQGNGRFGGFDREEVYVDPYNGNAYMTVNCAGGKGSDRKGAFLLVLEAGSTRWRPTFLFGNESMPIVMTSTRNGRLFMFQCDHSIPKLYWSDDKGTTLANKSNPLIMGDQSKPGFGCSNLTLPVDTKKSIKMGSGILSLSRVTDQVIRVAYGAIENGRQVVQIYNYNASFQGAPRAQFINTLRASPGPGAYGDIIEAAFVDTAHLNTGSQPNISILYWTELIKTAKQPGSPEQGQMVARYSMVHDAGLWSPPQDLSRSNAGQRRWVPNSNPSFHFVGDYIKGDYYQEGTALKFFAQWSETDPGSDDRENLHFNIVTVKNAGGTQ